MRQFIATIGWLALLCLFVVTNSSRSSAETVTTAAPSPAFWLQLRAGLSSYTSTPTPLNLNQMRPLFSQIEVATADYVAGQYLLAGRNIGVGLLVHRSGLIVAYHSPDKHAGYLMDSCAYANWSQSMAEKAVREIGAALGIEYPTIGYYDFRHPTATGATVHWSRSSGYEKVYLSQTYLPLTNDYVDRGYAICTGVPATVTLNEKLLWGGSAYSVRVMWGRLGSADLRAGQSNKLSVESRSFGGGWVYGAVGVVYVGDGPIEITPDPKTDEAYRRDFVLVYPSQIGYAPPLQHLYLPLVQR
jgi:hypothetical protein